ncbi:outer membrane protein assembly factor BamB family protein [Halostagnicola bangensis]
MTNHGRRRILKYAGIAATTGGLFATTGAARSDTAGTSEDESGSVTSVDGWSSLGGGPGNNGYVPETDGPDEPVVDWEYDHGGSVAIVDGIVFLSTGGAVHALAAADGSLEWKTHDIGAGGTPAVTADGVYVGGERLTKISPRNGDICCYAELEYDRTIPAPVVANDLALVVADGVLYAVDSREMEIEWEFDPEGDSLYEQPVAVADGAVFAVSKSRVFALELEDGTERWTIDDPPRQADSYFAEPNPRHVRYPVATDDVVSVGTVNPAGASIWQNGQIVLFDTETGKERVKSESQPLKPAPITEDRFYGIGTHSVRGYDRESGSQTWETDVSTYVVSSLVSNEDAVFAGLQVDGEVYGPGEAPEPGIGVYAFDDSGETSWKIETDDVPTVALADETLYACTEETLVAIRAESSEGDGDTETGDENADVEDGENDETTNESSESEGPADTDSDGNGSETGGDNESNTGEDGGSDEAPGFTAGAGIAGGAVALEWLRRRVNANEKPSD